MAELTAEDARRAVQIHAVGPHDLERAATALCACCGKWIVVKL